MGKNTQPKPVVFAIALSIIILITSCSEQESQASRSLDELKDADPMDAFEDKAVVLIDTNESGWVEIETEVAKTPEKRAKGLMLRESLSQDKGMLFVFSEAEEQNFWMKNTLIPLDMIFISEDKKVTSIHKNAVPCEKDPCRSYPSNASAQYVVEVNAGFSDAHGIKVGDPVRFMLGHEKII
jgi:hypothetical protein